VQQHGRRRRQDNVLVEDYRAFAFTSLYRYSTVT